MKQKQHFLHYMSNLYKVQIIIALVVAYVSMSVHNVYARMESSNYQINADVLSGGGNLGASTNYTLTDTLSENIIGSGSSANYILKDGFWQMVNTYVHFSVDSNIVDFGTLTPGTSQTGQSQLSVTTDAWNGYTLSIQKNNRLRHTNGVDEIQDHAGTVAMPLAWSVPSAIGLGFSVASGTNVLPKWSAGTKFATIPTNASEVFHEKSGYRSSADVTTVVYKLDVPSTQRSGHYDAVVTYTVMPSL